jgi:rubrerythrin
MKKNLYESVLQAITEIDLCEASCEDMLRLGISAEEGAINLYNRIAKELERRSESSLFNLFKDVSLEEKIHVGEFQAALEKFDYEEVSANEEGREEAEEFFTLDSDMAIEQNGQSYIIEKGDKIKLLKDKSTRITESRQILAPYDVKVDYIQDSSASNSSFLPIGRQKGGLGRVSSKNEIIEKGSPCEIVVMSTTGQGSISFLVMSEDFDLEIQKFVWLAYSSRKEAREDGWNI